MKKYLLGLDCGSTTIKAVLFDTEGNEIASYGRPYSMTYPKDSWIEVDVDTIWFGAVESIQELLRKSGVAPEDIKGVGACAWGCGAVFLDKDGKQVRPAFSSGDSRTIALVDKIEKSDIIDRIVEVNKVGVLNCHPAIIALWLKQNEPENYEKMDWICAVKDYLNFKLTGKKFHEPVDAAGGGFYDWEKKDYTYELFDLMGIPEFGDKLAPLAEKSIQIIGGVSEEGAAVTGLAAGTPVIAGMMDICACAVGTGLSDEGQACSIVGTWSINEVVCPDRMFKDTVATLVYPFDNKIMSMAGGCTSATNTEWFLRCFGDDLKAKAKEKGVSVYEVMTSLAAEIDPAESKVMYLPFISNPRIRLNASAGFHNIEAGVNVAELLHALYEGITFDHKRYLNTFVRQGYPLKVYRLAGGGAKSAYWAQMFADVLGGPVETISQGELGALGNCISAGVATGVFADFADACDKMLGERKVYYPDPEAQQKYQVKYEQWLGLVDHMCKYWDSQTIE